MNSYYTDNKEKFTDMLVEILDDYCFPILFEYIGEYNQNEIKKLIVEEFQSELPNLPYIGGKENYFSRFFVYAAHLLSIYNIIGDQFETIENFGELIYRTYNDYFHSYSWFKKKFQKFFTVSKMGKFLMKKFSRKSQQEKYEYDLVFEMVEPENEDQIYGFNVKKCGFHRYYTENGIPELTPYLCVLDNLMYSALDVGFKRETTIGMGGKKCDFRFVKDYETPSGLPMKKQMDYKNYLESKLTE